MRWSGRLPHLPSSYRILLVGTVFLSVGRGMYAAASVVYFTRWLGLSAGQVGIVLSCAGAMSLVVAVPLGALTDRFGAKRTVVVIQLIQAGLVCSLLFVRSFPELLVVAGLLGAADRGNQVGRQALVSDLAPEDQRVRVQAYIRTVFNVAVSVGVASAALVIASTTRTPFVLLIVGVTGCYSVVAVTISRLPRSSRDSRAGRRVPRPGLRLLMLGLLSGFLGLHVSLLEVGIPLWILHGTSAPRSLIAVLLLVNTALAAGFQVLASRKCGTVRGSVRTLTASAGLLAVSCVLFAITGGHDTWVMVAVLLGATALLTAGELLQSAAAWGLAYGLSPAGALGSHIGAFSVGAGLQDVLGPVLVAVLILYQPPEGWLVLSAAFLVCGALVPAFTRWAQYGRTDGAPPSELAAASTQQQTGD